MVDWKVELKGHALDLEKLASLSQPPEWSVQKRKQDGQYTLESDSFSVLSDAMSVQKCARENWLPLLNGALQLQFPRSLMGRIEVGTGIDSMDQQGVQTGHRVIEMTAAISVSEEMTITDSAGNVVPPITPSPNIIEMCTALQHDVKVRTALDHFTESGQWTVNLYKVVEIIHHDLGVATVHGLVGLGWATKAEADDFTSAVHNPAVSGKIARHASSTRQPSADPMDEDRARTFVDSLLRRWIQEKYQQLGTSPSNT